MNRHHKPGDRIMTKGAVPQYGTVERKLHGKLHEVKYLVDWDNAPKGWVSSTTITRAR